MTFETTWSSLRHALEAAGLIQVEIIPGVPHPYLKFHPTLAPVLWQQLSETEQITLATHHRQRYYQLSRYLYVEDDKNPHEARAIVQRELPNLLHAVNQAITHGDEDAVDFVDNINTFLQIFGLKQDREALTQKLGQLEGDDYLRLSNQGEALYSAGRYGEALTVFTQVLQGLGETPSYRRCVMLGRIGRCLEYQGQAEQAAAHYREAIAELEHLEESDGVKRLEGTIQADLGNMLRSMGDYEGARNVYEQSLAIKEALGDLQGMAVAQNQLGTLAMVQGNLSEAATLHQKSIKAFQQMKEPTMEAVAWHQLGMMYEEAKQWEEAERHYRESAKIEEAQGNLAGAAGTWNQLALVNEKAGRPEAAIAWYEKAIEGAQLAGDLVQESYSLNNLANLLQTQQDSTGQYPHLTTARQYAEESLEIKQTLDPAAAEIWKTYNVLAEIAEKQGQPDQARDYRQQARQAKAAFAGTQHDLQKHGQLIGMVIMTVLQPDQQSELEVLLQQREENGWTNLVSAIRHILDGERDEDALVEPLDCDDSMIVSAILQGIADPASLQKLLDNS